MRSMGSRLNRSGDLGKILRPYALNQHVDSQCPEALNVLATRDRISIPAIMSTITSAYRSKNRCMAPWAAADFDAL